MGVLIDLIVVDSSCAEDIALSDSPAAEFEGLEAKGIDPVKLCTLKSILMEKPYDGTWISDFELLAGDESEGPWVTGVPSDLVAALCSLSEQNIAGVSAKWHETEEFALDGWDLGDVETALRGIWQLALRARLEQKPMLMWMSV